MTQPPRLVVFDWDGTLVDSSERIVEAMQFAFEQRRWEQPSPQTITRLIGLPVTRMMDDLSGGAPANEQSDAIEDFARRFRTLAVDPPQAFVGLIECLTTLRSTDAWLAVATGKSRRGLDREMTQLELDDHFLMTRTADESRPKPHPQMMLDLLEQTGLEPDRTVMVGDTTFDVEMARGAGVTSIGVNWGNHRADELMDAGAHVVATDLADVPDLIDQLIGQ